MSLPYALDAEVPQLATRYTDVEGVPGAFIAWDGKCPLEVSFPLALDSAEYRSRIREALWVATGARHAFVGHAETADGAVTLRVRLCPLRVVS